MTISSNFDAMVSERTNNVLLLIRPAEGRPRPIASLNHGKVIYTGLGLIEDLNTWPLKTF